MHAVCIVPATLHMKQTQPRLHVNLLPQDPFFESTLGRVINWASTAGRYLVIFTQLIVIGSFATRFKLDRDATDLRAEVFTKSSIIESYDTLEDDVAMIQKRTSFLKTESEKKTIAEMFDILGKTMPVDVALQSIQTNTGGDGLTLRGTAIRSSDLTIFVRNLLISNDVRAVQVSEVKSSKEGQPGFEFTVSVQFGEKTVRTPVQQKKKST